MGGSGDQVEGRSGQLGRPVNIVGRCFHDGQPLEGWIKRVMWSHLFQSWLWLLCAESNIGGQGWMQGDQWSVWECRERWQRLSLDKSHKWKMVDDASHWQRRAAAIKILMKKWHVQCSSSFHKSNKPQTSQLIKSRVCALFLTLLSSFHAAVSTDINFFPGIGIYTLFLGGRGGTGLLNITAYPECMMSNWISV